MRRTIAATIAALALAGGATAAGAANVTGVGEQPMTVNPEQGPPTTPFVVSGEYCTDDLDAIAQFAVTVTAPGTDESSVTVDAAEDGSWSADLTVAADTPPGELNLTAECRVTVPMQPTSVDDEPVLLRGSPMQQEPPAETWVLATYAGTFTVTEAVVEDDEQDEPAPEEPVVEEAEAADDIVATPTLTG